MKKTIPALISGAVYSLLLVFVCDFRANQWETWVMALMLNLVTELRAKHALRSKKHKT